ncbi:HAMP domain-containing sensor histidine kinase [Ruminococcus sp.]|uniref:sensor histidine kinase n=1 Tax=Ruminococcus sp. TaxID=41978 RepID=UPI0025D6E1FF|nr:HAMP domain-containing sensor histidine kinase [Ruminococcus sp.]
MTIKKRLFISNTLMLVIPALVSILIIFISLFLFMNLFYKQLMNETGKENNLSYIHELLVEQSKEFLGSKEDVSDSKLYHTVEKYLTSQEIKLEIYNDKGIVCTIGSSSQTEAVLVSAMESLGGEGSVSMKGSCLYGEKIFVDGKTYHILIYSSSNIQESDYNEFLVKNIIVILCIMIIVAVIVTNRFLTKFVFKKIEAPLDILTDGVHQIRDGNLDYRITYSGKDEFQSVCEDFNDMAARLKESVEITQKNEQNRKELIAGISHDLRTPLTSIKAYIEGLLEGVAATPQMQQKYMKTILVKANDIDRMVDKLFLFSKLDLGDCPFYPEKLKIRQEIRSIVTSNEKEYREKGMQIFCKDIPQELEVYADPVQLRSAVTNILENSLKYKDSETVTVEIYCENSAEDVSVIIEDNGPGVPPEALPKLFDVFYRSDPSRNNPNKGSGLGLAITAKILKRFGGSIHAENLQPKGLRIVMTIPKEGQHE